MTVPFPRPENVTNLFDIVTYSNGVTGGYLGYVILFIITVVTYLSLLDHPPKDTFPAVMFVGFVSSIFLSILSLINPVVPTVFMLGLAASIAILWMSD